MDSDGSIATADDSSVDSSVYDFCWKFYSRFSSLAAAISKAEPTEASNWVFASVASSVESSSAN